MGTAFYVYETEEEYNRMYKDRVGEKVHHSPIITFYLRLDKKNNHLWVVTESSSQKERPRMERSIVHFRNGEHDILQYKNDKTVQLEKKNLKFDKDRMKMQIMPKTLRKSLLEFKVDRYYGRDVKPKVKVEDVKNYYDTVMDRINVVLSSK